MVTAVLGQAYGLPTWNACLSDFVVMLEGASMAVSGPRVLELATGEKISAEELGGAKAHAEETGFADVVAETEDECLALVKRFLSYLPSHNRQAPPVAAVPGGQTPPGVRPPERGWRCSAPARARWHGPGRRPARRRHAWQVQGRD